MDDLVTEFIAETVESLDNVDKELIELENDPSKSALIDDIFRIIHGIKGACGFFGLDKLASLAHAAEEILSKIRTKQLRVDQQTIAVILDSVEAIKNLVIYIGKNAAEPQTDYSELIQRIVNLSQNQQIKEAPIQETISPVETKVIENEPSKTIRVNVATLEKLMQSVTELVLNRNELLELDQETNSAQISSSLYKLNSITSLIQDAVIETRLQSIGYAWSSIPRLIHDLALTLHKKIKLVTLGESTRLDKQLIEAIRDPIIHMVRNSADHGIESPQERLAAGKPEEGSITLKAQHCNGCVVIEVADDGRGINISKIKEKILEKKLASNEEVAVLSDEQAINYICYPGFTTNDEVTDISGRGVGMDVVKENIEELQGSLTIASKEGEGSCITVVIPLTLAIMQVLIIESAGSKFAIPQLNIMQVIDTRANPAIEISEIDGHKSLRFQNQQIPCLVLSQRLKLTSNRQAEIVVICNVQDKRYGLLVEELHDMESIVLKPLSQIAKKTGVYNGNTILGSGEVVMLLSPGRITAAYAKPAEIKASKVKLNAQEPESFLLFEINKKLKALPIDLVASLKEVSLDKIQRCDHGYMLEDTSPLLVMSPKPFKLPEAGKQAIILLKDPAVGLMVDKILEVVQGIRQTNSSNISIAGKLIEVIELKQIQELMP